MKYGVTAFINDKSVGIAQFAPQVEALGFESIWLGEHDHLPLGSIHPAVPGGVMPDIYKRFPNPFTTLAAAAAVTKHVRLGTSVSLIAEHNPIYLAKEVATLDLISDGRVELGVGYGWNKLEMANNGVDPSRLRARFREHLDAMKAMWTQDTTSYAGDFVAFTESWVYPKPIQHPYPPIVIGAGFTPATQRDLVNVASGWMPIAGTLSVDELEENITTLRKLVADAGRDRNSMRVTLLDPNGGMGGKKSLDAFERLMPSRELLKRYEQIGVDRCVFAVPPNDPGLLRQTLEALAERLEVTPRTPEPVASR